MILVSNKTLHKRIIVMMKIIVMIQYDIMIMNCLVIRLKNKRICALFSAWTNGKKYSRMDQVKLFKGCLPQIFLGPFLGTLSKISCERGFILTLSWRRPLSYRNQSIDLQSKSMDWFLYDNGLHHKRVKWVEWKWTVITSTPRVKWWDAYSGPSYISKMKFFAKIVNH